MMDILKTLTKSSKEKLRFIKNLTKLKVKIQSLQQNYIIKKFFIMLDFT